MLVYFYIVPPQINSSALVAGPGNCLDLTDRMESVQQIGKDLCVRAGPYAIIILKCEVLQGVPLPDIKWMRDGENLTDVLAQEYYETTSINLTLFLPNDASSTSKQDIEGNYSCVATNLAGIASSSSYITIFGG